MLITYAPAPSFWVSQVTSKKVLCSFKLVCDGALIKLMRHSSFELN